MDTTQIAAQALVSLREGHRPPADFNLTVSRMQTAWRAVAIEKNPSAIGTQARRFVIPVTVDPVSIDPADLEEDIETQAGLMGLQIVEWKQGF